jgi:hypothetical protein
MFNLYKNGKGDTIIKSSERIVVIDDECKLK